MIAHTSYAFPVAPRRRLRGLGQSCGGANQPPCGQTAASAAIQALQPTVQNPQFSTQQNVGAQPTTTFTLDSYMAQWAAGALAFPGALQGTDPVSQAIAVAQSYCAAEGVSDCGNLTAIATKYGNQVAAALPSAVASIPPATTTGTTYSQQNQPSSASPGAGYVWDGTCWRPAAGGSCWSAPSSAGASSSTGGSTSTVVNPSPATQTVTDGSSLTSPTSVTSLTNGASVTTGTTTTGDIIPGIPNAAVFLGGGAALVLLVLAVQR